MRTKSTGSCAACARAPRASCTRPASRWAATRCCAGSANRSTRPSWSTPPARCRRRSTWRAAARRSLKPKCLAKLAHFPGLFDRDALLAARDLYAFDNVVTAPLHGYRDTDDYWDRASAKHVLNDITVPTLVLNARNDPFLPGIYLPTSAARSVTLDFPEHGGHVGFVAGAVPGRLDWLPRRLIDFLEDGPGSRAPAPAGLWEAGVHG
jgi:pimeloyl-ACP methyl ester carboxylesterase